MSKVLKGLKGMRVFPITKNDATTYTTGTAMVLPGAQTLSLENQTEDWQINADDTVYESGSDWTGMELSLTLAELTLEMRAHLEGGDWDETEKVYKFTSDNVAPQIGMSFMAQTSDGNYRMVKLLALRCTAVGMAFATKGEGDSASVVEITGMVSSRKLDNAVHLMKDSTSEADLAWLDTLAAPTP
ncbi:major tail protein [Paenibacillus massiliensis]|uniref:major tail protein n=1 Tax=Paenibacillus massiliensis TaxID=225917 RepID=UPI000472A8C6|nr:major tail protein [Paenibacillus massiliensis]